VDVEDEDAASRYAMEATDRDGTKEMPIAIPDPPEARGVVASQPWIAGIVAREATGRASAGRNAPSRVEQRLGLDEPTEEMGSDRTTLENPETPWERQPSCRDTKLCR
jgi:hypothetical protein